MAPECFDSNAKGLTHKCESMSICLCWATGRLNDNPPAHAPHKPWLAHLTTTIMLLLHTGDIYSFALVLYEMLHRKRWVHTSWKAM